ncbi:MAG: aminotransferase class I/II-fold pyridoxal phosphate-dependent enzyme [Betaproteobacteria bacterium]|nr:aminotransferase class I/II-fold pyridoxal phosphate-dependent enzyme [Betaproteobacteria bacterium]
MKNSTTQGSHGIETICVHAGVEPEPTTGAIMTPIFQTSTYVQSAPGEHKGYDYSRGGNPTRTALESSLAALEKARHGISFASGLAAVHAVAQLLNPGDHVLVCDDVYGGTGRLFRSLFAKYDIHFDFVDMRSPADLKSQFQPKTRLVWIETPTNPLLRIVDIRAVADLARAHGALTVVDNTFASPVFQQPLDMGADISLHSTTKYIGGHSDLVGGALMTNDDALAEQLRFIQFAGGAVNAPQECFILLRSIKTLALRMQRHHENACQVAEALSRQAAFSDVIFPGLESHPQHALARAQMTGYSGMVSVRLKGGFDDVKRFVSRLKIFSLAESLGGVESLVNHPETMTHASVPPEHRKKIGIDSGLLRFSVGIETAQDLVDDIRQAVK